MKRDLKLLRKNKGFSLVEAILSISVFAFIATTIAGSVFYAQQDAGISGVKARASALAEEGLEAVQSIRDEDYAQITNGNKGLAIIANKWAFSGTSDQIGTSFTRQINIEDSLLLPDAVPGKKITSTVTWSYLGRTGTVSFTSFLTEWRRQMLLLPTNPTALNVNAPSASQIDLGWSSTGQVAGFKIERAPDSGSSPGTFSQIKDLADPLAVSWNDNAANNPGSPPQVNTKYWYRIRAYDSDGDNSGYTGEMNVDSNVKGLWHLNEGGGGITADSSGNNNIGNINIGASGTQTTNAQAWANGANGKLYQSLNFDGVDDYVNTGNISRLNLTSTGTIEAWVKTSRSFPSDDATTKYRGIVSKSSSGLAGGISYFVDWTGTNATRTLRAEISDGTTIQGITVSNFNFGANWNYIAYTWNGSQHNLYINGVAQTPVSQTINAQVLATADVNIAHEFSGSNYWDGQIDEVRISNKARSASDIQNYYNESNGYPKEKTTLANTPTSPSASAASTSQINTNWASGGAQDHYHVRSSLDSYASVIYNSTSTSTSQSGLAANTQYTYRIYGVNGEDAESSTYANVSKYTLSDPPTLPVATDGTYPDKINVSWTASLTASSYRVYRDGVSGTGTLVYNSTGTSFDDAITGSHTYYIYSVNADNVENSSYITDAGSTGSAASWATPAFDTSLDVNHPGGTATTNAYDAYRIQVDGDYAYMIKYDGGSANYNDFFVINISGPTPTIAGYTRIYSGSTALTLINLSKAVTSGSNKYVYVTINNGTYEFARINVTNPAAPTVTLFGISVGSYTVNRGIYAVAGSPPTIFIAGGTTSASALFVIDGDTGATIKYRALTAGTSQAAEEVVVIGNRAYVSSDNDLNELQTISNADGTATPMTNIGNYNILTDGGGASSANALSIDGYNSGTTNTVLLGLTDGRLIKVNQNTSTNALSLGGSYNSGVTSNFNDVSINSANTLAFVATSNTSAEFRVVTISSMTSFGFHDISGTTAIGRGIAYHDTKDRAYMATQDNTRELYIVKPGP